MDNDFEKISATAKPLAYIRALAHTPIPYCQRIAELCDAEEAARLFYNGDLEPARKRAPLVELRYNSLSGILTSMSCKNILELASGFSPRGLIMTKNPEIRFVETDLREILQKKFCIISELLGPKERPNHRFMSVDALDTDALMVAARQMRAGEQATVIHEGLLPYLNLAEKKQLAANIMKLLQIHRGIWITPDILTKQHHEEMIAKSPAAQHILKTTGRNLGANLFEDFKSAQDFFIDAGFRVWGWDQMEFVDSINDPSLDEETVQQMSVQQIWAMSPK
jgi:hypothetical protein